MSNHNKHSFTKVVPNWFKKFNIATLIISAIVFIVLSAGVLGMPQPEAHFWNVNTTDGGGMLKIDVGLFDKFFFQWHRPHIEINVLEFNFQNPQLNFFDVSSMKNGLNLNPYPIFLTILTSLTLTLCVINITFNFLWNKKAIYNLIINIGIATLILVVLIIGLIFYYGNILEKFMIMSLDVRKLDKDVDWYFNYQANGHMPEHDLSSMITEYNLQSVVISYTTLGYGCVAMVCVFSGAIIVLVIVDYVNMFIRKNNLRKHENK